MVFVDQVQGSHRLRAVSSVGDHFPLTTTANGRAVLAMLSDSDAATRITAEKPQDPAQLARLLVSTRTLGFAEDNDDHTEGISAVGIAFYDLAGEAFAISVPIPTSRFADQRSSVIAALLRLKEELGQVLAG